MLSVLGDQNENNAFLGVSCYPCHLCFSPYIKKMMLFIYFLNQVQFFKIYLFIYLFIYFFHVFLTKNQHFWKLFFCRTFVYFEEWGNITYLLTYLLACLFACLFVSFLSFLLACLLGLLGWLLLVSFIAGWLDNWLTDWLACLGML